MHVGIDALLSRETARMRDSLAGATLGSDHTMLLARKRSTDWTFLAAAVTMGIGAGVEDPGQLLSSITICDATSARAQGGTPHAGEWPAPGHGTPLVADVMTCLADPAGSDFPCAIRWRIVHDSRGLVARALWHEPMAALRAFDAPLVPDRTTIRLSASGTDVECWGFGRLSDAWPGAPAPLDQLGDSYDLADAARHWWWARAADGVESDPIGPATACRNTSVTLQLPECDVVRTSPWRIESTERPHPAAAPGSPVHAVDRSVRGSISVPLRSSPSQLHVQCAGIHHDGPTSVVVSWIERGRWRGALNWTRAASTARAREALESPSHGWLDAQARLQLLQHVPTPTVLPEPYPTPLILGQGIDESAAHARATANIWQAAVTGDCAGLNRALADAESLRRRRALPRSTDAMALAALAESLLARGAPEQSIGVVVARHLLVAASLPPDRAAAHAERSAADLMPSLSQQEYAQMLSAQGRHWAAMHCTGVDPTPPGELEGDHTPAHPAHDPAVRRFSEWYARRHLPSADSRGAPAAIHARTLAISSADSLSPSGGIASSSSTGSVSTASSELASGSPGFTIVRPLRSMFTSVAGSSSRIPALDFPLPWQSKQRASKTGRRSEYETTTVAPAVVAEGAADAGGIGISTSAVACAGPDAPAAELTVSPPAGPEGLPSDVCSAVHSARVT